MNKLIPRISGYGDYTRVYAQTHVHKICIHKGSQWVLFVATVQYDPLQTLVNAIIYVRGLYGETLANMCYSFIHFTRSLHLVA